MKFIDRTFNANPAHANAMLAFILKHYGRDIPAGVCFHFELAGDILREETFALLEQAPPGAFQLEIGMQSFCEKTLAAVRGTSEGLENRLFAAVQTAKTADALYAALKTRRYAHSRLRRLALDAALGYTKAVNMPVPYVQVLGASARGISLLKRAKASATLPFGSSLASLARAGENAAIIAAAHAAAEDFTALCLASPRACGQAFTSAVQMPKL